MNFTQIESEVQKLFKANVKKSFIYDLLLCYGVPKATIKRLKDGGLNLGKTDDEIVWKKKLYFREEYTEDLHNLIDDLKDDFYINKHDPRFVIVTDFTTLLAVDRKTNDTLDILFKEFPKHFDFFLPLAGLEKAKSKDENPADIKAAEKMAKLFDEIKRDNPTKNETQVHNLNVFLSRLLFCFFAEDTGIFEKKQFTKAITSHTQTDGSDLSTYLNKLFDVMNRDSNNRKNLPAYLDTFPYVNGGLFKKHIDAPKFTKRSREAIISSGELDWSVINPDIFGSMMQSVVTPEQRGGLGMHYTSVPNIMKVIEPLFLSDLNNEFEKAVGSKSKLENLIHRIWKIKIFDPACGSGNFLIIAYKELRRLEMKILRELNSIALSNIKLSNFYGIELDDFAHEIAILSLWLAEHQMNLEFFKEFGRSKPALPLKDAGNIICGNACRLEWETVCPKKNEDEIFIMGNPPYLGFNERNKDQKADMDFALKDIKNIQRLDYIGCWLVKATDYIKNSNSKYAFVATNSICQGEQVSLIWPHIFSMKQEIFFAFQPFKWSNSAKDNAGVTCVILGIQNENQDSKLIFYEGRRKKVRKISPYLIEGNPVIITQRKTPLSALPEMMLGSSGIDGGNLILSAEERQIFIKTNPLSTKFIKPFIGGGDFIDGSERYCIWINDDELKNALNISLIKDRIDKCRKFRLGAGRDAKKAAEVPHRFFYRKHKEIDSIILPMTSSERRTYLPIGFLTNKAIVSNGVLVIYGAKPYIFGLLSSKMHMCWTKAVSGKLESRIRYSVNLAYNSFPFPEITQEQNTLITKAVLYVLQVRESHSEKTLGQLYDPNDMPDSLKRAHEQLDFTIDRCYRSTPFENDEDRLDHLFRLYEQMIAEEKNSGTLFEIEKKKRKKR